MLVALLALTLAQTPAVPGAPAAGEIITEDADDEAFRIGKVIRCPLCQGMSVAESPSPIARSMMTKIRELVAQGKSQEEIIIYFERSYGEFVRLQPTTSGVNAVVWVLPPVGLLLGLLAIFLKSRKPKDAATATATAGEADTDAASDAATPDDNSTDAYLAAVRDEVQ